MNTLVAGIGNIFLGDDGFGCEVARRLQNTPLPAGTEVEDFGIRGIDLVYALTGGRYGRVILVDAMDRGEPPGSLCVIEPDLNFEDDATAGLLPHGMDALGVLRCAACMGELPEVLLVGCQPQDLGGEAGRIGLSDTVQHSVARAGGEIVELLGARAPAALDLHPP